MLVLAEHNRTFGYAAGASVALHALLLLIAVPAMRENAAPPPEPPLVAHLAEPALPPAPPPAPAPAPQVSEPPKPPPKVLAKPKPETRPPLVIPAPIPVPQSSPEEIVEEGMSQSEPMPLAPPPVAVVAPPAAAEPPAARPPDPAAALARFRQQLVDLAARYKRYPPIARDNGWTGDVVVRIEVAANGAVGSIRVKTSSGHSVLDEQALEMFRKAAPEVAVPPELRGRDFSVEVRAIYNLQDRPG